MMNIILKGVYNARLVSLLVQLRNCTKWLYFLLSPLLGKMSASEEAEENKVSSSEEEDEDKEEETGLKVTSLYNAPA